MLQLIGDYESENAQIYITWYAINKFKMQICA